MLLLTSFIKQISIQINFYLIKCQFQGFYLNLTFQDMSNVLTIQCNFSLLISSCKGVFVKLNWLTWSNLWATVYISFSIFRGSFIFVGKKSSSQLFISLQRLLIPRNYDSVSHYYELDLIKYKPKRRGCPSTRKEGGVKFNFKFFISRRQ